MSCNGKERSQMVLGNTVPLDGLDRSKKEVAERGFKTKKEAKKMVCALSITTIF